LKKRIGFVSNSSSSSFIVIDERENPSIEKLTHFNIEKIGNTIYIPQTFGGNRGFGWENIEYADFADKLNWAALCAYYLEEAYKDFSGQDMLEKVLKEDFKVDNVVNNLTNDYKYNDRTGHPSIEDKVWGYIDHQSTPCENRENSEMFNSEHLLRCFLYNPESKIVGGNDNE
jgi:hypothetical protein